MAITRLPVGRGLEEFMDEDEVEAVAQAFYDAQEGSRGWQREPEALKERFRRDAHTAIAAFERHRRSVGAKVLVVEDDEAIRDLAVIYLEEAGFSVITAATGDEAIQFLQRGITPDVLFTDIRMPGQFDGWTVAKAYRERFPNLPVLYGTRYAETDAVVPGSKTFPKPYKMSHVVSFIEALQKVDAPGIEARDSR